MSNNQGFGLRSSSVSNMSAFKPFVPDVVPQQQQQQYHHHNRHQRHYSQQHQQQQQNTSGQAPVGSGVVFQPISHPPSYCGSASTLPRGSSPDNGYLSLEHPSRTASFVSQISAQFSPSTGDLPRSNNCGPFDQATPKENHAPGGRSQQPQDSSSDSPGSTVASYRRSQSSVNSPAVNGSWASKKSSSGFDFRCTPGRRQFEDERQNMYSTVLGGGQRNGGNPSGSDAKLPATPVGPPPPASGLHRDAPPSLSDIKNALIMKDTELKLMRETMTKNESAILQVFEDKKRKWQVEMSERKKEWDSQLQALQKKSWKTEQLLQFQVSKLHQENKKLQTKAEELETDKKRLEEQCQGLQAELSGLKSDMRGLLEDVNAKDLLDQFQSSKFDTDRYKIDPDCSKVVSNSSPSSTLIYPTRQNGSSDVGNGSSGRQMRRKYPAQGALHGLNRTSSELSLAKPDVRTLSLPELQRELENARLEVETCRLELEQERQNWKAEKEKVIDYQKRLQLSYLQILHKNRLLELDVQQLTGEMAELDIRQLSRDESAVPTASQGETVY